MTPDTKNPISSHSRAILAKHRGYGLGNLVLHVPNRTLGTSARKSGFQGPGWGTPGCDNFKKVFFNTGIPVKHLLWPNTRLANTNASDSWLHFSLFETSFIQKISEKFLIFRKFPLFFIEFVRIIYRGEVVERGKDARCWMPSTTPLSVAVFTNLFLWRT